MLEAITQFVHNASPLVVFTLILLASYIENIFPPIPGDTILIFGAYMVGVGDLSYFLALVTTLVGSVAGFMTIYYMGHRFGRGFIFERQQKWFSDKALARVDRLFNRWGYGVVLINRFMAGLRSVIALFAGVGHLDWRKVFGLSFLSSLVWNGVLIWLGARLGKNWEVVRHYLAEYNSIATIVFLVIIATWLGYHWRVKQQRKRATLHES